MGGDRLCVDKIWQEYTEGKQTYSQLAEKYNCSSKTIQRKIDSVRPKPATDFPATANVLMDTTYFGRRFGAMVFKDSLSRQVIYKQYVKQETNALYLKGIEEIARRGIKVQAIVCDGRKGLFRLFGEDIPVQMCNFHQMPAVRRYLTKGPKMQAGKELWAVTQLLTVTCKEVFEARLEVWYLRWESFLDEQGGDGKGRKDISTKSLEVPTGALKQTCPGCTHGT